MEPEIRIIKRNTIVVGTGAAGLNAADRLRVAQFVGLVRYLFLIENAHGVGLEWHSAPFRCF